jgi:hypothetical protein
MVSDVYSTVSHTESTGYEWGARLRHDGIVPDVWHIRKQHQKKPQLLSKMGSERPGGKIDFLKTKGLRQCGEWGCLVASTVVRTCM